SRTGALAQRIGPRLPMTLGPVVAGAGLALLSRVGPGTTYVRAVLPGVAVLGLGLALTVAPLTAAVLAAIDEHHVGVGSAINNATARVSGLVAVALVPAVSGLAGAHLGLGAGAEGAGAVQPVPRGSRGDDAPPARTPRPRVPLGARRDVRPAACRVSYCQRAGASEQRHRVGGDGGGVRQRRARRRRGGGRRQRRLR